MRRKFAALAAAAILAAASTPAAAADVPPARVPTPYTAPVPVAMFSWTGLYFGGSLGYGWSRWDVDNAFGSFSMNGTGFVGGGQAGFLHQIGRFVWGAEASLNASNLNALQAEDFGFGFIGTLTAKVDYYGTIVGRAGFAYDRWLITANGGWAYGRATGIVEVTGPGFLLSETQSENMSGWTAGATMQYALNNYVVAGLQYKHLDMKVDNAGPRFTANVVKLRLDGRFNWSK